MAGLFTFSLAGLGFLLIAAMESLPQSLSPKPLLFLRFFFTFLLSTLFILYSSLASFFSDDPLGPPLPLSSLAVAALFLLYSLAGLLSVFPTPFSPILPLPPSLLDLLCLFAFFQEFLLFYLRHKDLDGLENRYFDLLLIPILVCALSTLLSLARPRSPFPRLARAAGLALHGTWFLQMGFSFFSSVIAHNCSLHQRSWGNYTVKCKAHADYHRSKAIATLQFNCHLAFLVVVAVGLNSLLAQRMGLNGGAGPKYRPLNKELTRLDHVSSSPFTLDSDDEVNEAEKQHNVVVPISAETRNGIGGSH